MSAYLLEPLDPTIWEGYNRIDSVQNGVLLNSLLHDYWDSWLVSINPVSPNLILPFLITL